MSGFLPPVNKKAKNIPSYELEKKEPASTAVQERQQTEVEKFNDVVEQVLDGDFDVARQNLLTILDKTESALDGIIRLAEMSDHPRAYEVVATMIKTLADINKDLMELHQKKADIKAKSGKTGVQQAETIQNNQTNVVFNGTPSDLQSFLKGNKDG